MKISVTLKVKRIDTFFVRWGSYINIGYCPETSKDANGYNRYYRIKVLLNVAEGILKWSLRYIVLKLNEGEGRILLLLLLIIHEKTFYFLGGLFISSIYACS